MVLSILAAALASASLIAINLPPPLNKPAEQSLPLRVQSVLQAVHLLLAFESFVVVVGVDQTRVAEVLR